MAKRKTLRQSVREAMVEVVCELLVAERDSFDMGFVADVWLDGDRHWKGKSVLRTCREEFEAFKAWMEARDA